MGSAHGESWPVLLTLLPPRWQAEAFRTGAVRRLRGVRSVADLLRTLLLHVGGGYSLRETAARAKAAGLASLSDVALWERFRAAAPWWQRLCVELLRENGLQLPQARGGRVFRIVDGTIVREPGDPGRSWRIHYALRLPDLECDHLEITPARQAGGGEHLSRVPVRPGQCLLADRGFCHRSGVESVLERGADLLVRLNTGNLPLYTAEGERLALLAQLQQLASPGACQEWEVYTGADAQRRRLRLCGIRKSEYGRERALAQLRRQASKQGSTPKPETLEFTKYVLVVCTLPQPQFPAAEVLEYYRLRWQIELAFKRLKSLAQIGQLAKHDPKSVHSWLYGKLLLALLTQKLIRIGRSISPWGYELRPPAPPQLLA